MSLKLPDKGQWAFIGLVMCLVTYYTGSVAVYFLNGKTPLYITASLNKTKKVLGVKGLKYPSKEKMLSVGELESEVLL
ncbi:hypothetical protein AB0908_26265 (plasmid) [Enterobacter hormaechei subsp. xiangfangensis]